MIKTKIAKTDPSTPDTLKINFTRKRATGNFRVFDFKDADHFIAYLPSLNLSAYGENKKEARDRLLKEVLQDFFENLTDLSISSAMKELQKLGWIKNKVFNKRFTSNSFVDREGVLKNFNLSEETVVEETMVEV